VNCVPATGTGRIYQHLIEPHELRRNRLPQWSSPVGLSRHGEEDSERLLGWARECLEHIYVYTEDELRFWNKTNGTCRLEITERAA
jgi:hypothetical protein